MPTLSVVAAAPESDIPLFCPGASRAGTAEPAGRQQRYPIRHEKDCHNSDDRESATY